MSLRRIFSSRPLQAGAAVSLRGDAANHIVRVLRLRCGDSLVVFDGSGRDFDAQIIDLGRDEVRLQLATEREALTESSLRITLLQGICRGARMDTVIQKSTELGVQRIAPILAQRSVLRLDGSQALRKREHWQRIAIAAAEQCGRSRIPEVAEPEKYETAVPAAADFTTRLVLDPAGQSLHKLPVTPTSVALLVGPEGGLTDHERQLAANCGFVAVRLGPRILRTETAPLAALAILQFSAGDF